jgi:hypothetical protein
VAFRYAVKSEHTSPKCNIYVLLKLLTDDPYRDNNNTIELDTMEKLANLAYDCIEVAGDILR